MAARKKKNKNACITRGFLRLKAMILPHFLCSNVYHQGDVIKKMCLASSFIKNLVGQSNLL